MKRVLTVVALALVLAAIVVATAMPAFAKIQEVDTACENPGGNLATGQQPTCKTEAHEQESENQNPSGAAPPGHNK
jgi:hypothetical protein